MTEDTMKRKKLTEADVTAESVFMLKRRQVLKMLGITYVGQFSAGICKDAGYSSIAGQIELFARLSVLAVSMPVLLALLETVHDFL